MSVLPAARPDPIGAAIVVGLLVTLSGTFACSDVDTNSYATHAEAVRDGALDRGWLPEGLPPGVHEIREAHDLDSNRRWGLFSFAAGDVPALDELLGPEVSLAGETCEPPARIEWWPLLLRGPLNQAQIAATGLKVYRPEKTGLTFAVNWDQRRAYYWTPE